MRDSDPASIFIFLFCLGMVTVNRFLKSVGRIIPMDKVGSWFGLTPRFNMTFSMQRQAQQFLYDMRILLEQCNLSEKRFFIFFGCSLRNCPTGKQSQFFYLLFMPMKKSKRSFIK